MLQGWTDVPLDILKRILTLLSAADCHIARQISRHWRLVAQDLVCFKLSKTTEPNSLVTKVKALHHRRRANEYPHLDVNFFLEPPTALQELGSLLVMLRREVS